MRSESSVRGDCAESRSTNGMNQALFALLWELHMVVVMVGWVAGAVKEGNDIKESSRDGGSGSTDMGLRNALDGCPWI